MYKVSNNELVLGKKVKSQKDFREVLNKVYKVSEHASKLLEKVSVKAGLSASEYATYRTMLSNWEEMEADTSDACGMALYDKYEADCLGEWWVRFRTAPQKRISVALVYGTLQGASTLLEPETGTWLGMEWSKRGYVTSAGILRTGVMEIDTLSYRK